MSTAGLLRVLTGAGIGSRRLVAHAIKEGKVQVNGEIVTGFNFEVDVNQDIVVIDGKPVNIRTVPLVYLVLNKPAGVVSTTNDQNGRITVIDYVPEKYKKIKLFPVGRLDRNSTGLIILTNDGQLAYRLSHPKFEHEKEYLISVDSRLSEQDKKEIENGVMLEDGLTYPAKVKTLQENSRYTYTVTIHEGRKHIVRRMLARLGYVYLTLRRIRVANICLGELPEGRTRLMSGVELEELAKHNKN